MYEPIASATRRCIIRRSGSCPGSQDSLPRRHARRPSRPARAVWRRRASRRSRRPLGPWPIWAAASTSASMPTPTTSPKSSTSPGSCRTSAFCRACPTASCCSTDDNTILWGNGRLREWTGRERHRRRELLRRDGHARNPRPRFLPVPHGAGHRPGERFDAALFSESLHARARRAGDRRQWHAAAPGRHDSRSDRRSPAAAKALGHPPGRHRAGRPHDRRSRQDVGRRADRAVASPTSCTARRMFCITTSSKSACSIRTTRDARARAGRRHDAGSGPAQAAGRARRATA